MSICRDCSAEVTRWVDAYTDWGPVTGWRQYQTSLESRTRRSEEIRSIKINDRAALIRQQIALIKASCNHATSVEERVA